MFKQLTEDEITQARWVGKLYPIFSDIITERKRQISLWGDERHPLRRSISLDCYERLERGAKDICETEGEFGVSSWASILQEELYEALAAPNIPKAREELIHLAAVAVKVVEEIDATYLRLDENSETQSVLEVEKNGQQGFERK